MEHSNGSGGERRSLWWKLDPMGFRVSYRDSVMKRIELEDIYDEQMPHKRMLRPGEVRISSISNSEFEIILKGKVEK